VALAQSAAAYISLAVEYGFELSATRRIAQCGDDSGRMAEVAAGVFGCKALFSVAVIMLAVLSYPLAGLAGNSGRLWWSALLWGLSGGWSILWFFQGIQQVKMAGVLDITAKILGTAGLFVFVHSPQDNWKILALQGTLGVFSNTAAATLVYRRIPFLWPSRRFVSQAMREGWSMFLFKSSVIAMLSSNTFILGCFAPLERVGWYAAAEKISRSCWQLLSPLSQALYPEFSGLAQQEGNQSRRMAILCTAGTGIIGIALGLVLYCGAPLIVHILMGKRFLPSVGVLRLLAMLGPLVAMNSSLAFYWVFPAGLERGYTRLVLAAMAVDATLNAALASRYAETGTAVAVIVAEIAMLAGALGLMRNKFRFGFRKLRATITLAVSPQGGE
jgi:PST family polysaccharide transporter